RVQRAAATAHLHRPWERHGTACLTRSGQARDRREIRGADSCWSGSCRSAPKYGSAHVRAATCRRTHSRSAFQARAAPLPSFDSSHDREKPAPTYRPWPTPDMPGGLPIADGEENNLSLADQILKRDVPHPAPLLGHAAVRRIIAIIAHHEIMAGRN